MSVGWSDVANAADRSFKKRVADLILKKEEKYNPVAGTLKIDPHPVNVVSRLHLIWIAPS